MFAVELTKRLDDLKSEVASLLAHPGLARTNLQTSSMIANGSWQEAFAYKLMGPIFQSARMGALSQLRAATELQAQSGEQYGPRFNFRGSPTRCGIAKLALKKEERERLWEVSAKLISQQVNISNSNYI